MNPPFYKIGHDRGVIFHDHLEDLLTPAPLAAVTASTCIESEHMRESVAKVISDYYWQFRFTQGFKIKSTVITLIDPNYSNKYARSGEKIVLNGTLGDRIIDRYLESKVNLENKSEVLANYFRSDIPECKSISIESRKSSEFTVEVEDTCHFITEGLQQLVLAPPDVTTINMVLRGNCPRVVIHSWLQKIFPELLAKIRFMNPKDFRPSLERSTLAPMSGKHLLYQVNGRHIDMINRRGPAGWRWTGYGPEVYANATLAMNTYDESLEKFRELALLQVKNGGCEIDSKLVYIARNPGVINDKYVRGEDDLFLALKEMGFQKYFLENLNPLEQVALFNSAKCVVLQYGVDASNMIFANAHTHIIRICTEQTALGEWRYFIPIAHVSGCHYHTVFIDTDAPSHYNSVNSSDRNLQRPYLSSCSINEILQKVAACIKEREVGTVRGFVAHADYLKGRRAFKQLTRLLEGSEEFFYDTYQYWVQYARVMESQQDFYNAAFAWRAAWKIRKIPRFAEHYLDILGVDHPEAQDIVQEYRCKHGDKFRGYLLTRDRSTLLKH